GVSVNDSTPPRPAGPPPAARAEVNSAFVRDAGGVSVNDSTPPRPAGSPPAARAEVNSALAACGPAVIRFGLAAIKNVGEGAVEAVVKARQTGPFRSLFEFCERVDMRAVNRRVVESFIKSGSFDSLELRRSALFAAIDGAMESGQRRQRDEAEGQASLLGMLGGGEPTATEQRVREVPAWT